MRPIAAKAKRSAAKPAKALGSKTPRTKAPRTKAPATKTLAKAKALVTKNRVTKKRVATRPPAKRPVAVKPVAKRSVAKRPAARKPAIAPAVTAAGLPKRKANPATQRKAAALKAAKALLQVVERSLDDDQAVDVAVIDLAGKTSIADYMVFASGRSQRQVGAMADHLARRIKTEGHGSARVEGMPQCNWVLVDAGDVIVHLFRPEVRTFYNLEKMWAADFDADAEGDRADS